MGVSILEEYRISISLPTRRQLWLRFVPGVGANLTVASFRLVEDIDVVNFSTKYKVNVPDKAILRAAETTWRELITWLFSAPFDPRDDPLYVPTQYLAESIKRAGYGGVLYDSSLNTRGYNVAVFDPATVVAVARRSAYVTNLEISCQFRDDGFEEQ